MPTKAEQVAWLQEQLVKAQKALQARQQMAAVWNGGSSQQWRKAGCRFTRAQRLAQAATHTRIAAKCMRDIDILKAVITTLSS